MKIKKRKLKRAVLDSTVPRGNVEDGGSAELNPPLDSRSTTGPFALPRNGLILKTLSKGPVHAFTTSIAWIGETLNRAGSARCYGRWCERVVLWQLTTSWSVIWFNVIFLLYFAWDRTFYSILQEIKLTDVLYETWYLCQRARLYFSYCFVLDSINFCYSPKYFLNLRTKMLIIKEYLVKQISKKCFFSGSL